MLGELLGLLPFHFILQLFSKVSQFLAHTGDPLRSLHGNLSKLLVQFVQMLHDLAKLGAGMVVLRAAFILMFREVLILHLQLLRGAATLQQERLSLVRLKGRPWPLQWRYTTATPDERLDAQLACHLLLGHHQGRVNPSLHLATSQHVALVRRLSLLVKLCCGLRSHLRERWDRLEVLAGGIGDQG